MKVLTIDIETAPHLAAVWGLFKQNIPISNLQDTSRVMCFAAKWLDSKETILFDEHKYEHVDVITAAHDLLDEADVVISYNGKSFDLPTLNKEFVMYGLTPPSPYKQIDLYRVARSQFRFASNKLDHIAKELGIGTKIRHQGFELWVDCMAGCDKAWAKMRRYNKRDVLLTEKLYYRFRPWITNHPIVALYNEKQPSKPCCSNCGSTKVIRKGKTYTKVGIYQRYRCNACGTQLRSRFTDAPRRDANMLVGVT